MVETKEENKGMSEAGTSGEGTGGGEASSAKKSQVLSLNLNIDKLF